MKKKLIFLCIILFTGYILIFPKDAVIAASTGLVLWYERILPTLLPFAILSNILIHSGYLHYLTKPLTPVIRFLLPVSEEGAFIILSGFLFGFPMGSKNCADLLKSGQIKKEEADILFIITNNISPVFISSFILTQELNMPARVGISYLILYLPALLTGKILMQRNLALSKQIYINESVKPIVEKRPASRSQINFKIVDAGIMNGFETLTRLGGYIMLFSMIASMLQKLPIRAELALLLTGITEITNGISEITDIIHNANLQYIIAIGFTAFGGISGIAQTSSMIKDTELSLRPYILTKLWLTLCSTLLAWLSTYYLLA